MRTKLDTLEIYLETVGGTSWWASLITTLASQYGSTTQRFVGRVDGERRCTGPTFVAPGTIGRLPPEDAWAPDMAQSLVELRREIAADGWVEVGRGPEPWAYRYQRRPGTTSSRVPGPADPRT
jgi:hypothetical protein